MAMAELPTVLMLRAPPTYNYFESEISTHFHFIKAFESPLPLPEFLASSPAAAAATAMLVTALGPPVTPDILRLLPSLRCIVTTSVGVDHIDLSECRRRSISVASAGDVFSDDTADTAIALLIDLFRRISAGDSYVRRGSWKAGGDMGLGTALGGKRIGIVGLGKVGSKIGRRLNAFGCTIMYTSREPKAWVPYRFFHDIVEMAAEIDVLVVSCALTNETKHMVNKQVLTALGEGGVVVNIARGAVIDEEELITSLLQGRIAGAALDVFENEPFVPEELRGMDNVVLTPHMAVHTMESFRGVYECVTGNLKAFFSGQPLLTPIH